ncbi:MAG: hypothetical protein QOF62_3717 [Pyrinomonadaceae bacterium]|jgi:hypothetical protein|nr:hypothetical protein [Pyrinomonadaceae bacterium]
MNRLFIELYLDEDVSALVADMVRARGFTVTTTQDAKQIGQSDVAQLGYAVKHRRTLLTHNRVDFEVLANEFFSSGKKHFGLIIAVRRSAAEIAKRLFVVLNKVTADEMENQILYF